MCVGSLVRRRYLCSVAKRFGRSFTRSGGVPCLARAPLMSDSALQTDHNPTSSIGQEYTVVARRYRPQAFDELIGQEHVAKALSNAISTNRVGHAYLFTGARGVGKTSAARIFAKALNCVEGPTTTPCNECDICQSITSGEDIDVLEIDGASNRGIDEIRTLRQNVGVRPSRSRFKIYIIDEVHMLTREAFNALLKTLEEPPDHVKFIFCTTDPQKMPITILSRCQRYDFAGIITGSISKRLAQIAEAEGVEAEPEALEILARRAAGSMRDGQSLLEQLLAFAPGRITTADVHGMLGTAGDEYLERLLRSILDKDAPSALDTLQKALDVGVDAPQLLEQLLGYLRDCMAAAAGCSPEMFLFASPANRDAVAEAGRSLGLQTTLAAMQILDETLARLRESTQTRVLADLALVRICYLEDLENLANLIAELRAGTAPATSTAPRPVRRAVTAPPKTATVSPRSESESSSQASTPKNTNQADTTPVAVSMTLTPSSAEAVWKATIGGVSKLTAGMAESYSKVECPSEDRLVVTFPANKRFAKDVCEREVNLSKFRETLSGLVGGSVRLEFVMSDQPAAGSTPRSTSKKSRGSARPSGAPSQQQQIRDIQTHPMVEKARELFGAEPVRVDPAD